MELGTDDNASDAQTEQISLEEALAAVNAIEEQITALQEQLGPAIKVIEDAVNRQDDVLLKAKEKLGRKKSSSSTRTLDVNAQTKAALIGFLGRRNEPVTAQAISRELGGKAGELIKAVEAEGTIKDNGVAGPGKKWSLVTATKD